MDAVGVDPDSEVAGEWVGADCADGGWKADVEVEGEVNPGRGIELGTGVKETAGDSTGLAKWGEGSNVMADMRRGNEEGSEVEVAEGENSTPDLLGSRDVPLLRPRPGRVGDEPGWWDGRFPGRLSSTIAIA